MSDPVCPTQHRFSVKYRSYLLFSDTYGKLKEKKEHVQHLIAVNMKIFRGRNSQLVVSFQVVTTPAMLWLGGYLLQFDLASDWS